jgi:hypothetical protein
MAVMVVLCPGCGSTWSVLVGAAAAAVAMCPYEAQHGALILSTLMQAFLATWLSDEQRGWRL